MTWNDSSPDIDINTPGNRASVWTLDVSVNKRLIVDHQPVGIEGCHYIDVGQSD